MRVSKLSFGGTPIGGCYEDSAEDVAIETTITALKSGVNYIDTAPWYMRSEEVLGKVRRMVAFLHKFYT